MRARAPKIIGILNEHETDASVLISKGTFYAWKAKYSVMTASGAKPLDALKDENSELKRLLADQLLDIRP